jgi:PAS domain S-box-containing protein
LTILDAGLSIARVQTRSVAYLIAILALVGAVALRWALDPVLGDTLPVVTLFGAVALVVWAGGYRPAAAVAVLGYVACNLLFIEPRGQLGLSGVQATVGFLAYLLTCSVIIGIGETMRSAQRRSNERGEVLRVTLSSIGDAVITTDVEGRITYLNAIAASLTGWTPEDARGQPLEEVFRIVNERDGRPAENPATRALREGTVVGLANHTVLIGKDGVERTIDDSAAPIQDDQGHVSGCVLIFRDVSERRRWEREEAARQHVARLLAAIVESSDDAIVSKSLGGTIQSWNAGAERIFGYSAEEAVGKHISLIIPPDRIAEEDAIIANLKAGRRVEHFETERVHRNGTRLQVSLTISPVKDAAGNVVGASKIARNVTDRKRTEAERQKFVALAENSTDFIGMCDAHGVPFYINAAGLKLVGLTSLEEASRVNVRDFFFPEDQPRIMDQFLPMVEARGRGEIDVRFRNFRTGEARWMAYKVLKLDEPTGNTFSFATVSQDVTERRQMTDHLRKLAADLSDADRRKDEFLATLSHELRNPLAPLTNMLHLLKRDDTDADMRRRALDTMHRQLRQLIRLVDDLLDLSRITHDRIELRRERVDLTTVIRQAVQATRPMAEAAHHDLQALLPAEPIYLNADAVRLSQIFGNLLNNSCKYTRPGGVIRVSARREGSDAVVIVQDNGIGIPPDKLDRVFDMFTQVGKSRAQSQGGLGIGLTLVKRLVEMHGGFVEARSAGEDQGSEFIVRLPDASGESTAPSSTEAAPETVAARRILVVDDNRDAASSLSMLLQTAGHETYTAFDGAAALEAAERHRPDAMLLDIGLPRLNGYEVCRRVREQPWGRDMVMIALTGWGQEEDRRKSRDAGFDGHLVKPVDHAELSVLLQSLESARLSEKQS